VITASPARFLHNTYDVWENLALTIMSLLLKAIVTVPLEIRITNEGHRQSYTRNVVLHTAIVPNHGTLPHVIALHYIHGRLNVPPQRLFIHFQNLPA